MSDNYGAETPSTRIFVMSGQRLFTESVLSALEDVPGLVVTGFALTVEDALSRIGSSDSDILLFDASFDLPHALLTTREIKLAIPAIKLIVIGLKHSEENAVSFFECGISGYVSQDASLGQLISTIMDVSRKEMAYSAKLVKLAVDRLRELSVERDRLRLLSAREKEILELISQGLRNKDISTRLGISTATAKNHVHSILHKLKVSQRREAIQKARMTFVEPDHGSLAKDHPGKPQSMREGHAAKRKRLKA